MREFDRSKLEGIFSENDYRRTQTITRLTAGLESGEYGVDDDNTLHGPAGLEIDLNGCPSDWSNAAGITESQIRIGHTTAQSGNQGAYGDIAIGWNNYLEWVNRNDPIIVDGAPRDLVLVLKDDGYETSQTIEFVHELIETEDIFAIVTLGSPNTLATYDRINDECIPQPFAISGHPAWGDPENRPWTTGLQLSYSTESILWGAWIKLYLADLLPLKLAGVVIDNDFGRAYESSFAKWAASNPDVIADYLLVRHSPATMSLSDEMSRIEAFDPDVFVAMTAGNVCLLAIQEAGQSGLIDDINAKGGALFTAAVCRDVAKYMAPAGNAADGWWIIGSGVKDTSDSNYADENFIIWLLSNLVEDDLDPDRHHYSTGYLYGYPFVESVRIAAKLPGGLTRTNYILALRSLSIYHPMLLDGISAEFHGAEDAFYIEGAEFRQYDAESQTWNSVGDIVDVNGRTPNCEWIQYEGGCR